MITSVRYRPQESLTGTPLRELRHALGEVSFGDDVVAVEDRASLEASEGRRDHLVNPSPHEVPHGSTAKIVGHSTGHACCAASGRPLRRPLLVKLPKLSSVCAREQPREDAPLLALERIYPLHPTSDQPLEGWVRIVGRSGFVVSMASLTARLNMRPNTTSS